MNDVIDTTARSRFLPPCTFKVQVYRLDGDWYIDDLYRGIMLEELIRGMPVIIERLVGKRTDRFVCTFSDQPVAGSSAILEKNIEADGGCWYVLQGTPLRGWLCTTMVSYLGHFPKVIDLQWN